MCIPKYTDNKLKIGDVVRYYNSRYGYGIIYEIKETHISAFFSGINGDTLTFQKNNPNIEKTKLFTAYEISLLFGDWFWMDEPYINHFRSMIFKQIY